MSPQLYRREPTTDLPSLVQSLRRRPALVAITTLAVVALALGYSFVTPAVYSASSSVLVPQQPASAALNPTASQVPAVEIAQRTVADDLQFAQGDAVRRAAEAALGYNATASVTSSTTADVLTFTGQSGDRRKAAQIANAYATAYIDQQRVSQIAAYTQQVTALQASISQLQTRAASAPAASTEASALQQSITSLTQTLQQLQAASHLVAPTGATTIHIAPVPTAPISPKPLRNGLLGLLVGLLLAVGIAVLMERIDDRISSRADVEIASSGLPIIGLIPQVDSWKGRTSAHLALVEDSASEVSEAYRTLRTAVQFLSLDTPKRVLAITSSVAEEGKSTTVANLALGLARAGQRVITVSCDLRRPRLHSFFGASNAIGLTSVLLGSSTLQSSLIQVADEPFLRVLPSGPIPPNPAEILSLDRVRDIMTALRDSADIVLIDCPPVLPITDALLLSPFLDGMLVVATARTTTRRNLARTCELLNQVKAPLLGTILSRVPVGNSAYGYEYGNGYGYRQDETATDSQSNHHRGNGLFGVASER